VCAAGYTRGYVHYLVKARETTGARLLTIHNLAYLARLMADLRAAIDAGRLAERAAELRAGAAPISGRVPPATRPSAPQQA
jgi:queuine tRNA-ribosyltransferase